MDDRRLDFSPLDPGRDPDRFERMVRAVLDRTATPALHPLASTILARGKVIAMAAVAVALAAWVPALAIRRETSSASASADPVATVADWARAGAIPDGTEVLYALGVNNDR